MTWFKSLSTPEYIFIFLFIVLYFLFMYRTFKLTFAYKISYSRLFGKLFIRTLYFSCLIFALLGPSFGKASKELKAVSKDIVLAVDLSASMNANDVAPTRLEKVKFELKNIVDAFSGNRIGLIIFSSEAFVQCPLTFDEGAIKLFIETLNTSLVPSAGTDFSEPLTLALKKISEDEESRQNAKSKVIILISDGEDFGSKTMKVADEIRDEGIRVFTLGVGTAEGSKIRTRGGYLLDQNRKPVITKLNSRELKKIASATEGKYYEINSEQNQVKKMINNIKSIKGKLVEKKRQDVNVNRYYYFLLFAVLLMALDVLWSPNVIRL